VQIAKLTLYKQYKRTNLDNMSCAKLQLKVMLRSPKYYSNFNWSKNINQTIFWTINRL